MSYSLGQADTPGPKGYFRTAAPAGAAPRRSYGPPAGAKFSWFQPPPPPQAPPGFPAPAAPVRGAKEPRGIFVRSPRGAKGHLPITRAVPHQTSGLGRVPALRTKGPFLVGIPRTRSLRRVHGRASAIRLAERWAHRTGKIAHVHALGRHGSRGALLARVGPNGLIEYAGALGDALVDWACDQAEYASSWRQKMADSLGSGAQAALIGGAAAGLLAGLLKRPLLGVAVGALTGWATHAIWTAPFAE